MKMKLKGFVAILFLIISANRAKAQIINFLSCPVVVDITVYETITGAPCTYVCSSAAGQVIPAGGFIPFPTCAATACNVQVSVVSVGGTGVSSTVDYNSTIAPLPPSSCGGSVVVYDASSGTFKLLP